MYVRGSKNDYEMFGKLVDNDEWSWKGVEPYFSKHQTLDTPNPKDTELMPLGNAEAHGADGPIHTSFNEYYQVWKVASLHLAHLLTAP